MRSRWIAGLLLVLACCSESWGAEFPRGGMRLVQRPLSPYLHIATTEWIIGQAFDAPWGLAADDEGNGFLTLRASAPVAKFRLGDPSTGIGLAARGQRRGQVGVARGIALGSGPDLYVADESNRRVTVLSRVDGTHLRTYGPETGVAFAAPRDVTWTPGFFTGERVYVADLGSSRIWRYQADDGWSHWGSFGSTAGKFRGVTGVACSPDGACVYAVDNGNHRVQRFTDEGRYLGEWGQRGSGPGQFEFPTDVAVTPTGEVLIVDTGNSRIQKFGPAGSYVGQFGRLGGATDAYGFRNPRGITVRSNGDVYVCDTGNDVIKAYRPR